MQGLDRVTVPAGGTATLTGRAQEPGTYSRLTLDTASPEAVLVTEIRAGRSSVFQGTESVPGGSFRPDAAGMSGFVGMFTLHVGQIVTVGLRNTSGAPVSVGGVFT